MVAGFYKKTDVVIDGAVPRQAQHLEGKGRNSRQASVIQSLRPAWATKTLSRNK